MEIPAHIPIVSETPPTQDLLSASPAPGEQQVDLATVLRVSGAMSVHVGPERSYETILRIALGETGSERGVLILPSHGELHVVAEATVDGSRVHVNGETRPIDAVSLPAVVVNRVIRTHECVILSGTDACLEDPYFAEAGPCSVLCGPLIWRNALLGVLYLQRPGGARAYTTAHVAILTLIAAEACRALENGRLIRDLQDREAKATARKRAETLLAGEKRILEKLARGESLTVILDDICRLVETHAQNVLASVVLLDVDRVRDVAAPGLPSAFTSAIDGAPIGPATSPWAAAAYRGETVIVDDIAVDPLWANHRDLALSHGLRGTWSTPVFSSAGKVIATLGMYYREPRGPSADDRALVGQITHLAGVAIERALTEQQLRRSETYLAEAQRQSHAGSYVLDVATLRYIYWSEEMFRIWDFDPREGPPDADAARQRVHPAERSAVVETTWIALRAGHDKTSEMRIVLPNGTVKHLWAIAHPIVDASGALVQVFGTHIDVTERKRAEESLRQSESYLAEAQRLSHTGSWAFDVTAQRFVYWSDEMFRIWDFDARDGPPDYEAAWQRIHPADRSGTVEGSWAALRAGHDDTSELRIAMRDGTAKHIRTISHPILDATGTLRQVFGTHIDVTERKRAEESLLELATVLEVSQAVSGELVPERLVDALLRTGLQHAGAERAVLLLPRDDALRVQAEATVGPDGKVTVTLQDAPVASAMVPESVVDYAARTHESVTLDDAAMPGRFAADPYIRREGARSILCLPLVKQGRLIAILYLENKRAPHVFTTDRTTILAVLTSSAAMALDNSHLYRELQGREAKIRRLVDSNIVGVLIGTLDGKILESNDAFLDLLGFTRDEVAAGGLRWTEFTPPEWLDASERAVAQLRATGRCDLFEKEYYRRDGTRVPVLITSALIEGSTDESVTFILDLTERKRVEESFRRSQGYLAEAQRLSQTGSFAFDVAGGRYVYWSEELFRIWGLDPSTPPPDRAALLTHVHPDDRGAMIQMWDTNMREQKDATAEFRIIRSDGTVRYAHAIAHVVMDARGDVIRTIGTTIDITDRKRAEEERERLRQLEADIAHINRVSMMGELAAALAHEVKQPLTAAAANAQASVRWLKRSTPDLARASKAAENTARDVLQVAEIIDGMRALYGRGQVVRRERVDVNDVILEMGGLLYTRAERQGVVFQMEVDPAVPVIQADRVQLQQVLMNLMVNAIEAMHGMGGTLTVGTACTPEGEIVVAVRDEGVGLPAGGRDRLFEAFVTTKPEGTGLGLAISRRIVEAQGGRLWATANPDRGATFQFTLPSAQE